MFEIDSPGAVAGRFVAGNRETGQPPTVLSADWLNMMQDEARAILTAGGIAPDRANSGQVLAAIRNLQSRYTRMSLLAAQSIPNNIETIVTWPAALNDDPGAATTSGITVPAGYSLIIVVGQVTFNGNATGSRKIRILRNSVTEGSGLGAQRLGTPDAADVSILSAAGGPYPVAPGDTIKMAVYQTSGAALNINASNTWMACHFLR